MRGFEKIIAGVLILVLSGTIVTSNQHTFTQGQIQAANILASEGIINDHTNDPDAYNLGQNVLRQEIAAVARGIAGLPKKTVCNNTYADVSSTVPNSWACFSVEALADADLIALNDNFNPERNISKAEALGMMVNSAGLDYVFNVSSQATWQEQIVSYAVGAGIIGVFSDYDTPATRGWVFETAVSAVNSIGVEEDEIIDEFIDLLGDQSTTSQTREFEFTAFSETVNGQFAPKYSLSEIEVNKGDTVVFKITNTKGVHDILIDEYDVYKVTPLNQEVVVEFVADQAGEFEYYCTVGNHRAAGMWGTLKVLE